MGQFPAINRVLDGIETAALAVWSVVTAIARWLRARLSSLWLFLKLRLPFVKALTARHLNNPSTLIEDIAIFVIILYVIFGLIGYVMVYQVRSESRFTENVSLLYPLPAARVNSSFIWDHEYLERLRFLTTFTAQTPKSSAKPPTDLELRAQIMSALIQEKIIFIVAGQLNISVSEPELTAAYNTEKSQTPDFEKKIKQLYDMTPQQFQTILANQLLKSKVEATQITRIRVRHILVTTPQAAAQAEAAIKGGISFEAVAKQFSQDAQSKDKGGDLGFWTKGELETQIGPSFEQSAFSLPVNQISDPTQTKFGFHLIQVTERTGKTYETFDDWYKGMLKNYRIKTYLPI